MYFAPSTYKQQIKYVKVECSFINIRPPLHLKYPPFVIYVIRHATFIDTLENDWVKYYSNLVYNSNYLVFWNYSLFKEEKNIITFNLYTGILIRGDNKHKTIWLKKFEWVITVEIMF